MNLKIAEEEKLSLITSTEWRIGNGKGLMYLQKDNQKTACRLN